MSVPGNPFIEINDKHHGLIIHIIAIVAVTWVSHAMFQLEGSHWQ